MNRLRKLLSTVAAIGLAGGIAWGANVPIATGIFEPSQLQAIINSLIQSINQNTPGLINSQPSAAAWTAVTTIFNMYSASINAGVLTGPGQGIRIRCYGTTSAADGNNKTITVSFGEGIGGVYTANVITPVMATAGANWDVDLLVTWNASASNYNYLGHAYTYPTTSASYIASSFTSVLSAGFNSVQSARCAGTQGTGTFGDIQGVGFSIDTVK
jgi:hypothetical protein